MVENTIRLDKWLWFSRVVKTRTLAQKLIRGSNIRINKSKTNRPSITIKVGDVLTISVHTKILIYRVVSCGTMRGSFAIACQLYEDLSPKIAISSMQGGNSLNPPKVPRPDKYARRKLLALKRSDKLY